MRNFGKRLLGATAGILGGAVASLGVATPANATIIQYQLTTDTCTGTCGLSNYGTITVSDILGGGVHVNASLVPTANFVKTGALSNFAMVFSLSGEPNISIANLTTADFAATDTTGGAPNISAGGTLGSFQYGIACTGCGNGGSNPKHGPIAFDITNASITTAMFTDGLKKQGQNWNPTGTYFVVDLIGPNGGTGRVGAAQGEVVVENPPPSVPEPATLTLLGAALVGLGAMRRRRKN